MGRPIRKQSLGGASTVTTGEAFKTKGHTALGLFVVLKNGDTTNDTVNVRLEVRGPAGEWTPIHDKDGNEVGALTTSEFSDNAGSSNDAAMLYIHNVPCEEMRAAITSITDAANSDLEVDAYVLASNYAGDGQSPET